MLAGLGIVFSAGLAFAQGPPNVDRSLNRDAADTTNTDRLWPGAAMNLNLTGSGVTVGVWDGGDVRATHELFNTGGSSRVNVLDGSGLSDHATHVAGTIAGDLSNTDARGMGRQINIRSRDWTSDNFEMNSDAGAGLINLSNHSYSFVRGWSGLVDTGGGTFHQRWWGDYSTSSTEDEDFGSYGSDPRAIDQVLHDNPGLLSVWAAGNERNDTFTDPQGDGKFIAWFSNPPSNYHQNVSSNWYLVSNSTGHAPPPDDGTGGTVGDGYDALSNTGQVAKNTLVVGAMQDFESDPHDGGAMNISSFSSYGPTDDGRLAPHVVGNGIALESSIADSDTSYSVYSGTSMAAPNVTGTAALLVKHHRNLTGGDTPTAASQKALLVHTATDITNGPANEGPDYATGYGMVNAAEAAAFLTEAHNSDPITRNDHLREESLAPNDTFTTQELIAVEDTVKATLAWTDPAGSVQSGLDDTTSVLVNDLDLWIEDESSNTYFPWTLDLTDPSAAAVRTQANHLDNLEQVLIDNVALGDAFTIHVGHTGTLQNGLPQDFSLAFSGLAPVPEPGSVALLALGGLTLLGKRRRKRGECSASA